jgi:two-component system NtrC family sensor kinase
MNRWDAEADRRIRELEDEVERLRTRQSELIAAARRDAVAELAARVAHEVNNPLTGVLGYAELALAQLPPDDPARADIETIRTEALRARTIVQGLVDVARPGDPAASIEPESTPIDRGDSADRGPSAPVEEKLSA